MWHDYFIQQITQMEATTAADPEDDEMEDFIEEPDLLDVWLGTVNINVRGRGTT